VSNFYNDVLMKADYFTATSRVATLDALEPVTRAAVVAIMADAAEAGTPLILFETYRSAQRQAFLFKQGATELREVGVHHYGLAADLVRDAGGQPSWEGSFDFLGELAKKHGMVWGGDWKGLVDADHVQRIAVADQDKLFNGSWYPPAEDAPVAVPPTEKDAPSLPVA